MLVSWVSRTVPLIPCALLENGVEQPGDLQGVIYKSLDASGAWKYQIADEMKAVGLDVDKNKINI